MKRRRLKHENEIVDMLSKKKRQEKIWIGSRSDI